MHAVSFTKGCYLGQEIVERIRTQGHVNKKLVRLEIDGLEPVAPGAKLVVDGQEAEITCRVYSPHFGKTIALGLRQRSVSLTLPQLLQQIVGLHANSRRTPCLAAHRV